MKKTMLNTIILTGITLILISCGSEKESFSLSDFHGDWYTDFKTYTYELDTCGAEEVFGEEDVVNEKCTTFLRIKSDEKDKTEVIFCNKCEGKKENCLGGEMAAEYDGKSKTIKFVDNSKSDHFSEKRCKIIGEIKAVLGLDSESDLTLTSKANYKLLGETEDSCLSAVDALKKDEIMAKQGKYFEAMLKEGEKGCDETVKMRYVKK